jgi:uncharacterized protein YcgI (DUF1989 family)
MPSFAPPRHRRAAALPRPQLALACVAAAAVILAAAPLARAADDIDTPVKEQKIFDATVSARAAVWAAAAAAAACARGRGRVVARRGR